MWRQGKALWSVSQMQYGKRVGSKKHNEPQSRAKAKLWRQEVSSEHRLRGKDGLTSSCLCWLLTVNNKKAFERFVDGKNMKMKRKETKPSSPYRGSDKTTSFVAWRLMQWKKDFRRICLWFCSCWATRRPKCLTRWKFFQSSGARLSAVCISVIAARATTLNKTQRESCRWIIRTRTGSNRSTERQARRQSRSRIEQNTSVFKPKESHVKKEEENIRMNNYLFIYCWRILSVSPDQKWADQTSERKPVKKITDLLLSPAPKRLRSNYMLATTAILGETSSK